MVGQTPKTTINSAKTSKKSAKPSNTLSIAANAPDTPQIAWKFKPEDKRFDDFESQCWVFTHNLALLRDTLRSVGYSYDLTSIQQLRIIIRLLQGRGFKFKVGSKIYAIDPNFMNRLRAYYYKFKDKNPAKLNKRVKVSELNTLILLNGGAK
jgi:hypothetical protein